MYEEAVKVNGQGDIVYLDWGNSGGILGEF